MFGKILNLVWQILYALEQLFIDGKGHILKNNRGIWSHWASNFTSQRHKFNLQRPTLTNDFSHSKLSHENDKKLSDFQFEL